MRVTGTERAAEVVRDMQQRREGPLSITLGTGCCESTAPFLYESYPASPDHEPVGEVAGVAVLAPSMLRDLYPDGEELVVDVVDELAESLSIETELGVRLTLRRPDQTVSSVAACEVPASAPAPARTVVGELPEHLRGLRIR